MLNISDYKCIVIGASAGGMRALSSVLSPLPPDFPIPIIVLQHLSPDTYNNYLINHINKRVQLVVKEADEKEPITKGHIYIAPANYHLLVEDDQTFSLSIDGRVHYSRPSINVLFDSAAEVYKSKVIGIILTGANNDGAEGLHRIKQNGGLAIVQNPEEAEADVMPRAAIAQCDVDYVLSLEQIAGFFFRNSV